MAIVTLGCGGSGEHSHPPADDETHAQRETAGVSWPVIRDLDHLAHLGEVAADTGDTELMMETAERMVAASEVLWQDGVPRGVRNREQAAALVDDLRTLIAAMAEALEEGEAGADQLADPLRASHSVIASIMATAGMPHVHDHHHHDDHDHDHHPHDHDHDHDHEH